MVTVRLTIGPIFANHLKIKSVDENSTALKSWAEFSYTDSFWSNLDQIGEISRWND